MDAIDTFKAQALTAMAQTVDSLQGQVEQAQSYLARVRESGARDDSALDLQP